MKDFNTLLNCRLYTTDGKPRERLYEFIAMFGVGLDIIYYPDRLDNLMTENGYQPIKKELFTDFI